MREWRSGSVRERRPGVWEIRVAVATDPITGRAIQRSFTFYGERVEVESRCAELAADYAAHRMVIRAAPFVTLDDILEQWLSSDHDWRPSTWSGYRSNVRALRGDPIARLRVCRVDPLTVRAAIGRWRADDVTESVLSGRFRTLAAAALGWAYQRRVIERNPLDGTRPTPAGAAHARSCRRGRAPAPPCRAARREGPCRRRLRGRPGPPPTPGRADPVAGPGRR